MASRNSVKVYISNAFYHVYNRGVEQRKIFQDDQDYSVFLSYLQTYLTPKNENELTGIILSQKSSAKDKDKAVKLLRMKNYSDNVQLVCYALLPNHYHLLIKQGNKILNSFMNSIGTRYAMYFNKKYKRKGVLFQDVYKAVLIETDEQLLHLSRYIHLNPLKALNLYSQKCLEADFPFSLPEFLGRRITSWVNPSYILNYFSKTNPQMRYENFLWSEEDSSLISRMGIDEAEEG